MKNVFARSGTTKEVSPLINSSNRKLYEEWDAKVEASLDQDYDYRYKRYQYRFCEHIQSPLFWSQEIEDYRKDQYLNELKHQLAERIKNVLLPTYMTEKQAKVLQLRWDENLKQAHIAQIMNSGKGQSMVVEIVKIFGNKMRKAILTDPICLKLMSEIELIPGEHMKFKKINIGALEIEVALDYVKDGNNVYRPMTPIDAQKLADMNECILPTPKLVDIIWQKADLKLKPITFAPSANMASEKVIKQHSDLIQAQIPACPDALIAGHKKDVVITSTIYGSGKVAIYGWQFESGKPIQLLNQTSHSEQYYDYSHGIRLIKNACTLNGVATTLTEILNSDNYMIISGARITKPRYRTGDEK